MKSSKIITIIVSFLLGVITAMAYQESKNEEKNPLQQAVEQAQGNSTEK